MTPQPIAPFKVTSEDLSGLDKKTLEGIQPLLDALNVFTNQVVSSQNAQSGDDVVQVTFNTDTDSFPIVFKTTVPQPRVVVLGNIRPKDQDHTLADPFVMQGFAITDAGLVSIPFITGILAANEYALTFWVR